MASNTGIYLTYQGENDELYSVIDDTGKPLQIQKNRAVPESFHEVQARPLAPVFRVLVIAALGLAPAGLGTLFFVPMAMLWTIGIMLTRPLTKSDRIRVAVAVGISIGLLSLAIFLSLTSYSKFSW